MQYRPHRYHTQYPTKLHTPTGPQKGYVIDVNNTGARIKGLRDLRRGDKINIEILGRRAAAVVQWASNGYVGITFRPQITDDQVDTLRYRRDGRAKARFELPSHGLVEMR
ncbi:MAG: PilZ domain-containing protein [Pseudomonadota bacterium]